MPWSFSEPRARTKIKDTLGCKQLMALLAIACRFIAPPQTKKAPRNGMPFCILGRYRSGLSSLFLLAFVLAINCPSDFMIEVRDVLAAIKIVLID